MSEQTPNDDQAQDENPEDDQAQNNERSREEEATAGIDFIAAVSDERIKRYFTDNWAMMVNEIAGAVVEKTNIDGIAVKAAKILEDRWNAAAAKNQAARAAANGDDGDDGAAGGVAANGGGDGGGGDGDLSFVDDISGGDGSNSKPQSAPVAQDPKQAVAIAGMRLLSDPVDAIERLAEVWGKVQDRRKPRAAPRNEYDVIAEIASRNPDLVNYFSAPDPMSAPDQLARAMFAGAKSGMSFAEAVAKYDLKGGLSKKAPKFEVPKVDLVDPAPAPAPTPEPAAPVVAPMGQDPAAKRRRRRLSDVV
ncbi:hypothetical protein LCGC14_1003240 [marine sediment metagenome]|uniref:Uncharacterized protein n=1 Tax=marine sediment metagenome TaxID=412755 RepID=A0A0F9NNU7_9ZZZZ